MKTLGKTHIVLSPSDYLDFMRCEFSFLRNLDAALGRRVTAPTEIDEFLKYAARLGDRHEREQLNEYKKQHDDVVEISRDKFVGESHYDVQETLKAIESAAPVIFQAAFYEPEVFSADIRDTGQKLKIDFKGYADFVVLQADGRYQVQDTKLTRVARAGALLQLALYAEQLQRMGARVSPTVALLHGDKSVTEHKLSYITEFADRLRGRIYEAVRLSYGHCGDDASIESAPAVAFNDARVRTCLNCEHCRAEMQLQQDLGSIAEITPGQRRMLLHRGVKDIPELLAKSGEISAELTDKSMLPLSVLQRLTVQARAQLISKQENTLYYELIDGKAMKAVRDEVCAYISLGRDSLYRARLADSQYRAGLVFAANLRVVFNGDGSQQVNDFIFRADGVVSEAKLAADLLEQINELLQQNPATKIFYFGQELRSHLRSIALHHRRFEVQINNLLNGRNLVDLKNLLQQHAVIGVQDYSLESLAELVNLSYQKAGLSLPRLRGKDYSELKSLKYKNPADKRLPCLIESLESSFEMDVRVMQQLHSWLIAASAATAEQELPGSATVADEVGFVEDFSYSEDSAKDTAARDEKAQLLKNFYEKAVDLDADDPQKALALRMIATSMNYFWREANTDREQRALLLNTPTEYWAESASRVVFKPSQVSTVADWHLPSQRSRQPVRRLNIRLNEDAAKAFKQGTSLFFVYETPAPLGIDSKYIAASGSWISSIKVESVCGGTVTVLESNKCQHAMLPAALIQGYPPPTDPLVQSLQMWAAELAGQLESRQIKDAGYDLLIRSLPRLQQAEPLPRADMTQSSGVIDAITKAALRLDSSVLPVQGPPGSGKTYTAARVIKNLVDRGWRVGVLSQSHDVVENLLNGVVKAGVSREAVFKKLKNGVDFNPDNHYFTITRDIAKEHRRLAESSRGCVVGGTAWTFALDKNFSRKELDLLVVDEGGQFGLAQTLSSLRAAKNLMLVGDPQQLPQVSRGDHPFPVDSSALGWLMGDAETLSPERGYFLGQSWRMRPELCAVVSELSYNGELISAPQAERETVTGWYDPGCYWHPVAHDGNTISSPEEAATVARLCAQVLRAKKQAPQATATAEPFTQADVIVVAPYNAQVKTIKAALESAGMRDIRVGTVDKFQGQEALVSIVSLASSRADDADRGVEFLLGRNRLNVALSRAKWSAHLVCAADLEQVLPTTAAELIALSGYFGVQKSAIQVEQTPHIHAKG